MAMETNKHKPWSWQPITGAVESLYAVDSTVGNFSWLFPFTDAKPLPSFMFNIPRFENILPCILLYFT